jgi:hypothetical protein
VLVSVFVSVHREKVTMFYQPQQQQQSFPELLGQYAQPAAGYIYSRGFLSDCFLLLIDTHRSHMSISGFNPVIMAPYEPMSRDLRMDRVRLIVCPMRGTVVQVPYVG